MATQKLPPQLEKYQLEIQNETTEIRKIEEEYQKVIKGKRSLTEKKNENDVVLQEFNLVENDDSITVYKLVGPVLAKQDFDEAKTNVKTRLDYISKEIDRMDALEKEFLGKVEDKRKNIMACQRKFQ